LLKNHSQLWVIFVLASLWLVRKRLLAWPGQVCLDIGKVRRSGQRVPCKWRWGNDFWRQEGEISSNSEYLRGQCSLAQTLL